MPLLNICIKGGRIKVGNQAPPIALIVKIKKVPSPFACAAVLLMEASIIPKAVHAGVLLGIAAVVNAFSVWRFKKGDLF